jgi:hypothetical protein
MAYDEFAKGKLRESPGAFDNVPCTRIRTQSTKDTQNMYQFEFNENLIELIRRLTIIKEVSRDKSAVLRMEHRKVHVGIGFCHFYHGKTHDSTIK